jgi:ParG
MTDLTDFLNVVASAEDWAGFGADDREPEEPTKRFTIEVPASLHRRVRAACAKRGLKVSDVLRDLLEDHRRRCRCQRRDGTGGAQYRRHDRPRHHRAPPRLLRHTHSLARVAAGTSQAHRAV